MLLIALPPSFTRVQWANQSYNVAVNYANRNASSDMSTNEVAVAYGAATATSLAIALSLGQVRARARVCVCVRAPCAGARNAQSTT